MNTITLRLACTVAALAFAAPALAQPPAPPAPSARHASKSAGWAALSWAESWQSRQGPETTERISRSFKVGGSGSLDLGAISGDIIVQAGGGDTITVEAIKRVRSRNADEAKRQLANTDVTMTQNGTRVEVRLHYMGRNNHASVDFKVSAPAGTSVNVRSVSGDVEVVNVKGEVRAESVSGDVTATGTPRLALAKTVSGDLELSGVSSPGTLELSTVSGDMTVRAVKVRGIDAESVSGSVVLTDVACDRASVKSMSGDVEYLGPLTKNGRYELRSHSGDIRLTLPGDIGFELEASTFSGNVRSDLPITSRAGDNLTGSGRRRGIRGTHGDGSALLIISTFSGDVAIARR